MFPGLLAIVLFGASIFALVLALQTLEPVPVYLIWLGLGTALISVLGVLMFNEVISPLKLVSVALVMLSVVGLIIAGEASA